MQARPLPIPFQLIATDGWCSLFSHALLGTDIARDATGFMLVADGEGLHQVLQIGSDLFLDAEGTHSKVDLESVWSAELVPGWLSSDQQRAEFELVGATTGPLLAIRRLLMAYGWRPDDLPSAAASETASDDLDAARASARAYRSMEPEAAFSEWLEDAAYPTPQEAALVRALAAFSKSEDDLFFEDGRTYGLRHRQLTLLSCQDNGWVASLGLPDLEERGTADDGDAYDNGVLALRRLADRYRDSRSSPATPGAAV